MELVQKVTLVLHLLGMASLIGGALVQVRDDVRVVNVAMLHGAMLQVVTGVLLVGLIEGQDVAVDHLKVAVKLAVALVVTLLCWMNRTRDDVPPGLFGLILIGSIANVGVAVLW